jgi:hypothetical protein
MPQVKVLKDKAKTRVKLDEITSYSADYDLVPPSSKVDTIILSIGSAVRKLSYNKTEDRDQDYKELDDYFNVDSQVR